MITTINQINEKLSIMDKSLAMAIESNDVQDLRLFNETQYELHTAIYGRTWGVWKPIQPTFNGFLHVKPEFNYLLNSLKIW